MGLDEEIDVGLGHLLQRGGGADGLAEALADSWLEVELTRAVADDSPRVTDDSPRITDDSPEPEDPLLDPRRVRLVGHGPRWE